MIETEAEKINERHNVNGCDLHVTGREGDVEIWLNTEVADFDGLCIGGGESRQKAVADAIKTLEGMLVILKRDIDHAVQSNRTGFNR